MISNRDNSMLSRVSNFQQHNVLRPNSPLNQYRPGFNNSYPTQESNTANLLNYASNLI